tara:strand:+ start:1543 stop:2094 length:552 start_codon:yes stop_codon:yes gene_type:complete
MAKKKTKTPAYVLKQFEKAMYKAGDRVVIEWLGQIKIGYVKRNKENAWGYSYMVEVKQKGLKPGDDITNYPCGIQIKDYKTDYAVGLILHDRTQRGDWSQSTGIYENTGSNKTSQRNDNTSVGGNDDSNSRKDAIGGSSNSHKDGVKSSATRVHPINAETRESTQLDDAINKQKDFLNGFVKD